MCTATWPRAAARRAALDMHRFASANGSSVRGRRLLEPTGFAGRSTLSLDRT